MANSSIVRTIGIGLLLCAGRCLAQADLNMRPASPMSEAPSWVVQQVDNPDDPRVKEYARQQKSRVQLEKELYKIRFEFIHNIKNKELRSVGIHKIRSYTQPAIYESLLNIFGKEDADVRQAIVEHLADQKNDLADTTLAWAAVFGKFKDFRADSTTALLRRIKESGKDGEVRNGIKTVIAHGLRSKDNDELASAAGLAQQLKLIEAIPMLINAQVQGSAVGGGGGGGGDDHSLAWILVGTQQAYVSDLTPVVGDSAVAFDPQVSVVTSGTVLRIVDAVVITYQVDVHNALVGLTSDAWGKSTQKLGWDQAAWHKWYKGEFVPFLAQKAAAEKATAEKQPT